MSYTLEFSQTALKDIEKHKKAGNKVVLKKIESLLNELREHPITGTGQPEKLITVYVLSVWSHYGDK